MAFLKQLLEANYFLIWWPQYAPLPVLVPCDPFVFLCGPLWSLVIPFELLWSTVVSSGPLCSVTILAQTLSLLVQAPCGRL